MFLVIRPEDEDAAILGIFSTIKKAKQVITEDYLTDRYDTGWSPTNIEVEDNGYVTALDDEGYEIWYEYSILYIALDRVIEKYVREI